MSYLKSIEIYGFKKFKEFKMNFNEYLNILVGENEAGKSTILEAIKVVLNQQYRTSDKSILFELFNKELIDTFKKSPSQETLPSIKIDLQLDLKNKEANSEYFFGQVSKDKEGFGIIFECKFDEELGYGMEGEIREGNIPFEYYTLSWKTYAGHSYQMIKRPLHFLFIDTSNIDTRSSFNYYNKMLFMNSYDEKERTVAKNTFREGILSAFDKLSLHLLDENRKFGIDTKKIILENILSVFEDDIALENKGSGMENLIKTRIALNKSVSHSDVIMIEEPENHLSFQNLLKMLKTIEKEKDNSQLIIATHNSMIASRLNLRNIVWITNESAKSLRSVDEKIAKFFEKADNNGLLQLLLSKRAILVEGNTEYLLIPYFFEKIYGRTIEECGITVISCNGISYKNYLNIIDGSDKRVAVITDNDKNKDKIINGIDYNEENISTHIFMSEDVENEWTWESAIYFNNVDIMEKIIEVKRSSKYLFNGNDYGKVLGKMLNNKVETAYKMIMEDEDYKIPNYVQEALEWINE